MLLALTAIFFITTLVFGWMALAPKSAPIKTTATRQAASGTAEEEIKDVATRVTENLLTYKPSTVKQDLDRAKKDGTEEFATKQIAAFGGKTLESIRQEIVSKSATSTLRVKGVAITSADDETATVLVVGERTIDSNERSSPSTQLQVVQLTLLNSGGWKVDDASPATNS